MPVKVDVSLPVRIERLESRQLLAVAAPVFSHERGFYDAPFELAITAGTPGAAVRYTTDGSAPSATRGTVYTGPIPVSTTDNIRAISYMTGDTPSPVVTHSYVFVDDVIRQPSSIPGFPNTTENVFEATVPADTGMDPNVVNDPAYSGQMRRALTSIPSMMITADIDDIFGSNGFYDTEVERPVSIELIDPAHPGETEQVNGAAEPHSHDMLKRSIRLSFKSEYGPTKWNSELLERGPLNGPSATKEIDNLVLRGGNNRSWTRTHSPDVTTFTEDQWLRDSQIAMTGYGSHGAFVHLYLNGVYWGLYNAAERPDEGWQGEYFDGPDSEFFSVNASDRQEGDPSRWNYLTGGLIAKDMTVAANYNELRQYLDVEDYADYVILNWYQATTDWPNNNFFAGNRTGGQTRFFAWDGEWSWDQTYRDDFDPEGAWVHPWFQQGSTTSGPIQNIWRSVIRNADFQTLFADRVYLHTANGGALTAANARARFDVLNNHIRDAVIAESARWGDALETLGQPTRTRDVDWQRSVNVINNLINGNDDQLIDAVRDEDYYPSLDPASFNQRGGRVNAGFDVLLSNPNGSGSTIYYTTDGTDPRASGGGLSPSARQYEGAIDLLDSATIRTRVRDGSEWSAQNTAEFTVGALPPLRVTEIMYNPAPPTGSDPTDGDEFEFIRLTNVGSASLILNGFQVDGGIEFTFGQVTLGAGESLILAENPTAFASRYGAGVTIAGDYSGKLDDDGERIQLLDAGGATVLDFSYDDAWYPEETDGQGKSLVIVDQNASANSWGQRESWRPSDEVGGTPGTGVTPEPENAAPSVSASGPASITLGDVALIGAVVSDDGLPDGSTVTIQWSEVDGPGDVTFANPAAANTTASFSAPGTYALRLTASDGALSTAADLTIAVNPVVAPPPPEPEPVFNSVVRFVLVNALTGQDLGELNDGDTISLSALGAKKLTILAEVAGDETKSVRFGFDKRPGRFKPLFKITNERPLALFGTKRGTYRKGAISRGGHTLTATPFTGVKQFGEQGATKMIRFNVVA